MTGRASPHYGHVSLSVQGCAESGMSAAEISRALASTYPQKTIAKAIERARSMGVLPRAVKKDAGRLSIRLPGAAGQRLQARAAAEGMTPSQLARLILHRASRVIDTMEIGR